MHLLGIIASLTVVAMAAGAFGVMLGYVVETPQGAFSFTPLVMAFTVFNTAMMPRDMYAAVLRPFVDASPVTAVSRLVDAIVSERVQAWQILVFFCWFVGLVLLSALVLSRKMNGLQR